jgi:site-specific recombinase XerD
MHSRVITLKHLLINGEKQIGLKFYPNPTIQNLVKTLDKPRWSKQFNMVYVANTKENLNTIFNIFRNVAWLNGQHFFNNRLKQENTNVDFGKFLHREATDGHSKCPEEYIQKLEINRYSENTARVYITCFEKFMDHHKGRDLLGIDELEIRSFLQSVSRTGKSDSYLNQMVNAIKFYYEVVMEMPNRFYLVDRPRKKAALPKVISKEQVKKLIDATGNIKHRCIASLLYSSGLRKGELLNLKLTDVDSSRMVINVIQGKGKKDRQTVLSPLVLTDLRQYYKAWKPKKYLFESPTGGKYGNSSVLKIIKYAAIRAGIKKKVTPHMLRHSFATHLLEDGVDLRYIQVMMGHSSTKTTEVYTQVATHNISKIVSPLDTL